MIHYIKTHTNIKAFFISRKSKLDYSPCLYKKTIDFSNFGVYPNKCKLLNMNCQRELAPIIQSCVFYKSISNTNTKRFYV